AGLSAVATVTACMTWVRSRSTRAERPAGSRRNRAMPADMRARLGQTELPNLVLAAAGCAGAGRELAQFVDVARVGALISKSIMAEPHTGNPAPRLTETPSGLLNSVGLQGPGVDAFLQRDLPWLLSRGARVVVSIP